MRTHLAKRALARSVAALVLVASAFVVPGQPATAASTRYEAEQATITDGVVESNHAGFTGTGFVNYNNATGSSVEWTVTAPDAGEYSLIFRYANGTTTNRPTSIAINGTIVNPILAFPGTGAWTNWQTQTVRTALSAGTNTVRATATTANGGPNVDSVTVDNQAAPPGRDWSRSVVDSTMARSSPTSLGLGYAHALFLYGTYLVYQRTQDARYLNYIKAWGNAKVNADGGTGSSYNNLDSMLAGNVFLILHRETGEARYQRAAQRIWNRFPSYPTTTDGGYYHSTSSSRVGQLWADGVFMSQPFVARYGVQYNQTATGFNRSTNQMKVYYSHLRHANGLLYHAYDEHKDESWANPQTGQSPEVWCRAVGWFGMTLIDILEILPADHPNRTALIDMVRHLAGGYQRWQDPATGRWFQLPAKPTVPGNWTETSCSSMFTFTISRAVERGYIDASYQPVANKGYAGVLQKVSIGGDGRSNITDICIGTNVGNQAYYLARTRATNDFHGLGAFLIMNEQLIRRPPTT